jgi:hypothetical protein
MTEEEFNLSDEIECLWCNPNTKYKESVEAIDKEKVKEFIRLVKEGNCWCSNPSLKEGELCSDCKRIIKLAGDKLI